MVRRGTPLAQQVLANANARDPRLGAAPKLPEADFDPRAYSGPMKLFVSPAIASRLKELDKLDGLKPRRYRVYKPDLT